MSDQVNNIGPQGLPAVGKPAQRPDTRGADGPESFKKLVVDRATQARADQAARMAQMQAGAPPAAGGLKWSAHAQQRMRMRSITFTPGEMDQIQNAVGKAAAKGARESLLLINNKALVVSVPNRTVITAVDEASLKENVFTNIDSAVIL
ncbi:MAG: flagellar protein [Armatimonadetes bacterium]|nr:flagellar protein [Armatimonadota bacterium]